MNQHNSSAYIRPAWFVGLAISALFAFQALVFAADEVNGGDIVVTDVRGTVNVFSRGATQPVKIGSTITLPASIRTGTDGQLDLRQGVTTVAISANSTVDIPTTTLPNGTIDRIVQPRGSAFYKVGKRETQKLRVETPYLVAVVKGTQFNVVAQPETSTIALFEGLLEVWAADSSDVVELHAGEIAIRYGNASSIRVLRMDTGETLRAQASPVVPNPANSQADANATNQNLLANTGGIANMANTVNIGGSLSAVTANGTPVVNQDVGGTSATDTTPRTGTSFALGTIGNTTDVSLGSVGTNLGVDTSVDLASGSIGVNAGATVGLGNSLSAGIDTSSNINLGSGSIALTNNIDAGIAGSSLDVGTSFELNNGSLIANTSASLGTTNIGASLSVGTESISAGISLGGLDVGVNAGLGGVSSITAPTGTSVPLSEPLVSIPAVTTPLVTTPIVTAPAVTLPAITTPVVTTPVITIPAVTTPVVTTPAVTTPDLGGLLGGITSGLGLP